MENFIIQTENLTKRYRKQTSVNRLNLEVRRGEIYGFLGPNGAGKTTTIRMLLGLIKPTTGHIKIFGRDFQKNKIDILRKIGSLVESPSYYGHLTGYENLEAIRRLIDVSSDRITEVLNIVRLNKAANRLTKEYSLGMKQRLGIAAALLSQPELLILDEPTNGLDPAGIQEIRELIKDLPNRYGMTVVVSSHLLSEIDQMATKVGIITNGQLLFQDEIEVLRKRSNPRLKIGVSNPQLAAGILKEKGWITHVEADSLWANQTAPEIASEMNTTLVEHGLSVYRLEEHKRSLEDIFLEITGKEGSL
ncbi:ABC transporter ATP-binding protein [Aneurinibacillus migulanus]|uniref:ABC-2 type transport system ATP-binding protein n=1 Tax=Aneurinibacillus migulanus TaxID=47500 RepID=A0A0D1WI15_ANEMI|nr:ABC transporter ATP-binding protein [Aneurinibacillus migulanus]KIV58165.1 bacitracin ABC transporter ATP-binding protein [Aneurinibacillus migulanus]KON96962.1 bacitracin ABC transporter ATP-binding protein [Aneurinibacillus migulanus]MED0896234.1 ABC transporter ATP-binding protein [Aneurinibacillus migulanus]MED1618096.1 ABC transporter ATP-binding protein [Aneurinibacillus migulanus]SDJ60795.1 ABC-2 type transport system ATP-binding protein [Aneurinibacillus migulanus]